MIELVLVFCLSADPSVCREERPSMDELPPNVCATVVPELLAAAWLDDHPAWTFRDWRCEPERRRASLFNSRS